MKSNLELAVELTLKWSDLQTENKKPTPEEIIAVLRKFVLEISQIGKENQTKL